MIENIFRSLFFFFDTIIYQFIVILYDFVILLAKQQVISSEEIENFGKNIYALLAIFMLFRLAFVLLNAIIDPDKLTGEKGFTKIMTRVIQSLFLIVLIPFAFDFAYDLQNQIIDRNIMTRVIFGGETKETDSAGKTLAKTTLGAFYRCNDVFEENGYCRYGHDDLVNGFNEAFPDEGTKGYSFTTLTDILNNKKKSDEDRKEYLYEYNAVISTICGGFIVFLLISFTVDVAVRAVKLSFLQLITPVAVIGYIEPGGGIFKKWLKMVLTTFTNLFIRLLALSFIAYIISIVVDFDVVPAKDGVTLSTTTVAFVRIFIIIGTLIFAKEAPKMLSNLFGLDEGSLGSLNPFKKLGAVGAVGAGLLGAGAAVGAKAIGGGIGALSGGFAARSRGGNFLAGAGQGMLKGAGNVKVGAGYKGGIKGIGKSLFGGTIGASGKGGQYAASRVTGNENEKVGFQKFVDNRKSSMANRAERMHEKTSNKKAKERYESIMKNPNEIYKNDNYKEAVNNYKNSKKMATDFEKTRQYWLNQYQNNPDGEYEGQDGQMHSYREAYEIANKNYISAQKNIEYYKSKLEKMDEKYEYREDANTRQFIDDYEKREKYSKVQKYDNIAQKRPDGNKNTNTNTQAENTQNKQSYSDEPLGWM